MFFEVSEGSMSTLKFENGKMIPHKSVWTAAAEIRQI